MAPTRLTPIARLVLALALLLPAAGSARAQSSDARVTRVRRLVNAGDRAAARQVADSMLVAYAEGTPEYADGLYARAISSGSAADAERDYLRISIEYGLSPRAEDALMMLAQLRLARGDRVGARRSFERLARDHPTGEQSAKASFWAGRLALEDGDGTRACPALLRAQELAPAEDVELRNQIDYFVQRCRVPGAIATRDTAPPAAPPVAPPPAVAPPVRRATVAPPRAAARDSAARREARESVVRDSVARDSVARDSVARDSVARTTMTVDTAAAEPPVKTVPTPPPTSPVPAEPPARPAAPQKEWSVQVAAFPKERDARALSEVLVQRGFTVRVFGAKPPFRVRVGRYATREEAAAALGRMKASRVGGVVVEAEPR